MREHRPLTVEGLEKSFDRTRALQGVSLEVQPGEVIGLIGANGAGKSTLVKVLAGVVRPDAGRMLLGSEEVRFDSPRDALEAGIALNPQDVALVPGQSVAENIFVGNLPSRVGLLSRRSLNAKAMELLARVGLEGAVDPSQPASSLTAVEARLVSIAETLSRRPGILILDEPSAALPTETAKRIEPIVKGIAASGSSVIFVSHRLGEIRSLSDRVIAMRDGRITGVLEGEQATEARMVELVGGGAEEPPPETEPPRVDTGATPALVARDLSGRKLRSVSLEVRSGEIVGIGGLYGSGRSELLRLIAGAQAPSAGSVEVFGRPGPSNPRQGRELGIGYLAEGRAQMVFPDLSVAANATIALLDRINPVLTKRRTERDLIADIGSRIHLKGSPTAPMKTLSGGNQQKVCIARWLLRDARLLLFDEPTAGIDVHARAEIHNLLRDLAHNEGMAVIVASAEPEELVLLCQRVIVLAEGRVAGELIAPFDAEAVVGSSYALAPDRVGAA